MRGLNRFALWRALTDSRRWMLREAWVYLLLARLAIRLIPFRRLSWFFQRPAQRPEAAGEVRARLIQDVRWAIWSNTRHQRESIVCFPRAVAAQAMLRQRGVSTTLFYGATSQTETGLAAHVWLQDGDQGLIGHRSAAGHKVLARFDPPPQPAAPRRAKASSSTTTSGA